MTPNRKPAKSTPSPKSLRERVLKNCLSEIRSKRNSLVQEYRVQSQESKNELMKSFVNNVYRVTKQENDQRDSMEQDDEDGYPQSLEHQEFLRQIADAVAFELDKQQYYAEEEEFLDITESEDILRVALYDPDDNTIICPLCRNGAMYISEASGTASCSCGALISLYVDHSSSQSNSKQNSAQNSQEICYEGLQEKTYDRENTVLSASELKRRLGNVYDRHKAVCQQYQFQNQEGGNIHRFELEYQIFGGHLCGYCAECSFYEQIT